MDFGARERVPEDDFPDYVDAAGRAVAAGEVERGVAVCGSGVGACVAANKVAGVRAALITDGFSARQGVEDDDMNLLCLGSRVVGQALGLGTGAGLPRRALQRRGAFSSGVWPRSRLLERSSGELRPPPDSQASAV